MKKDNIPGLEGYYIIRLGTLWSRYHKSGKYLKLKEEKLDLDMNLGKRFVD